jgi:hypothetical protein
MQDGIAVAAGACAMLEQTAALVCRTHARRKVLMDVNRAHAAPQGNGTARRALDDCGIELTYDSMEIEL